jgi:hypothetical protein
MTSQINGELPVTMEEGPQDLFIFTMERDGCYIEARVPLSALPDDLHMKEYMQNTAVDMYSRLRLMVMRQSRGPEVSH